MNEEQIWQELVQFFGNNLAHPDVEPRRFEAQLKIFKHVKKINNNGQNPTQ